MDFVSLAALLFIKFVPQIGADVVTEAKNISAQSIEVVFEETHSSLAAGVSVLQEGKRIGEIEQVFAESPARATVRFDSPQTSTPLAAVLISHIPKGSVGSLAERAAVVEFFGATKPAGASRQQVKGYTSIQAYWRNG